jgi:hypothetical protein
MNLYEQYGKLMVQKEMLDNEIMRLKQLIGEQMKKDIEKKEVKKDVKKSTG